MNQRGRIRTSVLAILAAVWVLTIVIRTDSNSPFQYAYIGPGAGFAFLGSFLSVLAGFLLSMGSILLWPFRMLWRLIRRRQGFRHAKVKRIIFLGLDGLDPRLTERYAAEGKLPNLTHLMAKGSYHRLRTTFPALSPVAWSTFATGVNPARHNIFDFLNRNLKTYVPELAAARVYPPRRVLRLGSWRIPLSSPWAEIRRKSQPFWKLLGDHAIPSTVIRVPITFPPDHFHGRMLSAMSTPDLKGTQGSFSHFSTRIAEATYESGSRYPLTREGSRVWGDLEGPENSMRENGQPLQIRFQLVPGEGSARLEIGRDHWDLRPGEYSPWIQLRFHAGPAVNVYGIARFLITEIEPEISLYVTPIQIDPEHPALPISHPPYYAAYLANLLGTYSTLGMAEDTWALNEGVIDEKAFLAQAYSLFSEREAMFRNALEKTPRGVVACVFDTSDRVQHMFFRHLDNETSPYGTVIEDLYKRMDDLVGFAATEAEASGSTLFVLSDHGFCSFRRGINLNAWLRDHGYLVLKDDAKESGPYFRGVDWTRTRCYTMGLGGLYLNLRGREASGIVEPGEEERSLKQELVTALNGLRDLEKEALAIRTVYEASSIFRGPYLPEAPDLIIGYAEGYRTSWDAAVGKVTAAVFEDNRKAWSGDHSVDPVTVPGILVSNCRITASDPGIEDMAPTALALFGVERPAWMEGKPLVTDGL